MIERLHPPKALVLQAPGINRSQATKAAYEQAGCEADIVHLNQLESREVELTDYQIFSMPGGFSYGDHIQSGRILALQMSQNVISDQIYEHLEKGRLVLGVCNGFQALVQSGLLPFGQIHPLSENTATLTHNKPNQFQSRWVHLRSHESKCPFVPAEEITTMPIAHSEGRFLTINSDVASELIQNGQIVYSYCTKEGHLATSYPDNPNGSLMGIAAICDPSGQILGVMPHAEDFVRREHYPNWRRMEGEFPIDGLEFFRNIVKVAKEL